MTGNCNFPGRGVTLIVCLLTGGCATHHGLSSEDRVAIRQELLVRHNLAYLRLSYFVTGFFGDNSKRLLTPFHPDEVRAIYRTVSPGSIERTLPAGTPIRITRVEFPTSWVVAQRAVQTPREQIWVYLTPLGRVESFSLVLVLREQPQTKEELRALLDRYLTPNDPTVLFSSWTQSVKEAVRAKTAVLDMPADALEMALGYPDSKYVTFDESSRQEEWRYPSGRRVFLASGRVVRF